MSKSFDSGHALIVGVGADLPDTVQDARGLAAVLRDEGRCAFPTEQVNLLTGPDAHRANVLSGLGELAKVPADASVIVYFSGHGYRVGLGEDASYYLMPHGYKVRQLAETAVSGTEFADRLAAIKSERLLVLLDCCHAGGFDVGGGAAKSPEDLPMAKAPLPDEALSLFKQLSGRFIITSSRADELSYAGKPYSAFTAALIGALCGQGAAQKDGYVRVMDVVTYSSEVVPRLTKSKQHPAANFREGGNFRLAYYAGGDEQPKALPENLERPEIEAEPGSGDYRRVQFDLRGQTVTTQTITVVEKNPGFVNPGWSVGTVHIHHGGDKGDDKD